jgi:hypothetical protein
VSRINAGALDVLEVFQFEYWLRFYFMMEEEGSFYVRLEDSLMERIEEQYPHLSGLAEKLNATHLTPEISQTLVGEFIFKNLEGKAARPGKVQDLLDSKEFNEELYLFNMWVNLHERQLDAKVLSFERWQELFQEWRFSERGAKVLDAAKIQETSTLSGRS